MDRDSIKLAEACMETTRPKEKWLSEVPFDSAYLDLNIETRNIKYVIQSLKTVSVEWYNIGIALGLPVEQLEVIEKDYHGTPIKLTKMIACWINNCELHTWRTLIEALFELGHRTAVSAAIRSANQTIMKVESSRDEPVPTKNWSREAERHNLHNEKVKQKSNVADRREKKLLEKICNLL